MHIHGNFINAGGADLYSSANSERAAAAQRAAETRRKLLKNAQSLESAASPEETLLIGSWVDSRHSEVLSGDEYRTASTGRNADFD